MTQKQKDYQKKLILKITENDWRLYYFYKENNEPEEAKKIRNDLDYYYNKLLELSFTELEGD